MMMQGESMDPVTFQYLLNKKINKEIKDNYEIIDQLLNNKAIINMFELLIN